MKKIIIALLAFITVFTFWGCGDTEEKNTENTAAGYSIYLSADAQNWEVAASNRLISRIKERCGVALEINYDSSKRSEKELLVGRYNLEDNIKELFDYTAMGYNGFAVKSVGQKYVITMKSEAATDDAIAYFVQNVLKSDGSFAPDHSYIFNGNGADGKHINVDIVSENRYDIYKVPDTIPSGYRYGPSIIVYQDGSIDAWFAGGGSGIEQWDWITYRHSDDGITWSEEKAVLQPTPYSNDHYSCCDPAVIYLNGYYYMGYTSTANINQCDNNLYVARSKNPDGPFEKWNGKGWGGNSPMPLVHFTGEQSGWGIGEASFTELDGVLYIYYTLHDASGRNTMVATADANDENWPLTMVQKGKALENITNDAIDVKYIDDYKKFIAVASDQRLSEDSYIVFFESSDGLRFTPADICKKEVYYFCHNPGMAGSENGHIVSGRPTFIMYAYGQSWGVWNTLFQEIKISVGDEVDLAEKNTLNIPKSLLARDKRGSSELEYAGITVQNDCVMRKTTQNKTIVVPVRVCTSYHDRWDNLIRYSNEVKMYGYDESILKRKSEHSLEFSIIGKGETMVTIEFRGLVTYMYVIITEPVAAGEVTAVTPFALDTLEVKSDSPDKVQIKSKVFYDDGRWELSWSSAEHGVTYEYDNTHITIDENGCITPVSKGSTTVKVCAGEHFYELTVNVV